MNLVIRTADSLEKAKSHLIFRADLPWKKPDGTIGYRKGWVKPEDSKVLDKHRAAGGKARDMLHIQHEEDLFDVGEGESWGHDDAPAAVAPDTNVGTKKVPAQVDLFAEPAPEAKVGPPQEPPLRIEPFSQNAFIVIGDRAKYADAVKEAAGKFAFTWDAKRGGWVFSKKREDAIRGSLGKLLDVRKDPMNYWETAHPVHIQEQIEALENQAQYIRNRRRTDGPEPGEIKVRREIDALKEILSRKSPAKSTTRQVEKPLPEQEKAPEPVQFPTSEASNEHVDAVMEEYKDRPDEDLYDAMDLASENGEQAAWKVLRNLIRDRGLPLDRKKYQSSKNTGETPNGTFKYLMRLRPFSGGAQPKEGIVSAETKDKARDGGWSVVEYLKPLTKEQQEHFSMDPWKDAATDRVHVVGETALIDGHYYKLNANHRWERVGEDKSAAKYDDERPGTQVDPLTALRDKYRADPEREHLMRAYLDFKGMEPEQLTGMQEKTSSPVARRVISDLLGQSAPAPSETPAPPVKAPEAPGPSGSPEFQKLNRAFARDIQTVKEIDSGKSPYDRSAFTTSVTGKLRRLHANGEQALVDALLDDLKESTKDMKKPFLSPANTVWQLHSQFGKPRDTAQKPVQGGSEPAPEPDQNRVPPVPEPVETLDALPGEPLENVNGTPADLALDPALPGLHDLSTPIAETKFRDYGSWSAAGRHVNARERGALNLEVEKILLKPREELTQADVDKVRRYSGFGGVESEGERGALYDFYTSPPVAKMVWQVLNKITPIKKDSTVLEPACGGGVFFETAPEGLRMDGVEYDARTAAVASILQPRARISAGAFEQFNLFNDEKYDHVVGNAPFGDRSVQTAFMDMPGESSLDRYFVRRSLDNLADGGSMAMIVAPGVMANKGSRDWRAEILKHGQFMGAIKLPDSSFKHTHTGVSPDVLIFRKYPEEVRNRLAQLEENGMKEAGFWNEDWVEGTYFEKNPGHMVGEKAEGNWGRTIATGETSPEALDAIVKSFKPHDELNEDHLAKLREMTKDNPAPARAAAELRMTRAEAAAFAAKTLRVGQTKVVDGVVYRLNENHRWARVGDDALGKKLDAVKAIAEAVKGIRAAMQAGSPVGDLQAQARKMVEDYREAHGNGHDEDKDIKRFLNENPKVQGIHEAMATGLDSPVLNKTNIYDQERDLVDGHNPAIAALTTMGKNLVKADEETIRAYFPTQADSILEEIWKNGDVFLTPDGEWQLREDFIAGNAWEKIDALNAAAVAESDQDKKRKYLHGVDELTKAIGWVTIEDADYLPQSNWIPGDILNAWMQDENGMNLRQTVAKDPETGKWFAQGLPMKMQTGGWNSREYMGTGPVNNDILYFLNGYKQKSSYNDTETYNRNVIENFKNWVMNNTEARARMEELFNRNFNTELGVPTKTYSVNIDGWNPEVVLGGHQWQTIHHLYRQGKGISALGVGFGKTKAGIALLALLKQEGKITRPWLQVPNNKVKDWVDEISGRPEIRDENGKVIQKRKPGCMKGWKVGYIDTDMPGYGNQATRYKKYQELANGDWDIIIMPESSGTEIQLSPEEDERITRDVVSSQLADGQKRTERKTESKKQTLENKLDSGKKNKTITFEDLGCDSIMVDEFHRMKNLFSSSLSRETGLNDGRRSERALSMFKKMEHVRGKHNGKNVFGLTATPLTNSPLEYYNLMQHIAPEELQARGIANIDDFIRNYAEIVEGETYDCFTGQLKMGKRLESFRNLRSLQDMFFKYTDMQNDPAKIGLKKPKANNHPNILPKNETQIGVMREIKDEMEQWKADKEAGNIADGDTRNFLTYYSRFRTASLDLELYDPIGHKGWVNPKAEELARNAIESLKATGGGQVIFCDRVLSSSGAFNMHEKLKDRLVAHGFKPEEIIIVNGITKSGGKMSDSALEKDTYEAVKAFNGGKYKAIIGSTATLGEGLNLQANSAALHHFDIPYQPSNMIQRNGRIDRQGNDQGNVVLHTYATAGTTDNYAINLVMEKESWINKLLKTKSNVFTNPESGGIGADPQEMLLALTEEWGEKDKADEMRAKVAQDKEAAIKAKHSEDMKSSLELLSRARGSLRDYDGDRGNLQYQNRLMKVSNLERSLANNPEFQHLDLLGDNPPDFIYSKNDGKVYKPGDIVATDNGIFKITEINHKKGNWTAVDVDGKTDVINGKPVPKTLKWSTTDGYGKWRGYGFSANHYPNPSPEDMNTIKVRNDFAAFDALPREEKGQHYMELLQTGGNIKDLPGFVAQPDGKINAGKISGTYGFYRKPKEGERFINPYTPEGAAEIAEAYRNNAVVGYPGAALAESVLGDTHPVVREKKLAKFREKAGSLQWEQSTAGQDRVDLKEYTKNHGGDPYSLRSMLLDHPDWELKHGWDESKRDYVNEAVRKTPLQKALVIPFFRPKKPGILLVKERG